MTFANTYESHVVGMGLPFSQKPSGNDAVTWIPFCQALSISEGKSIQRFDHLHAAEKQINRQSSFAEPEVNLVVIDNNEGIFSRLNIYNPYQTTGYFPMLRDLYTGTSGSDGGNIYLITDTDTRYRDQIGGSNFDRQVYVVENTFLSNISWSVSANAVAQYNFSFVGTDYISGSWTGNLSGINLSNAKRDVSLTVSGMQEFSEAGSSLDIRNANGVYIGNNVTVSGAPNLGQIKALSWSIPINRYDVRGLGNPFTAGKPMSPNTIGSLNIEYNYEAQKYQESNIEDQTYEVVITSTNNAGDVRNIKITGAQAISMGVETQVGSMDTASLSMEFPVSYKEGIYEENAASYYLTIEPTDAFGVNKIISTYDGPLFKLIRSTDSSSQDFFERDLYNNSITTWAGTGHGDVQILYSQKENLDLICIGPTYFPRLVTNGAIITGANKHPMIDFWRNSTQSFFTITGGGSINHKSVFSTIQLRPTGSGNRTNPAMLVGGVGATSNIFFGVPPTYNYALSLDGNNNDTGIWYQNSSIMATGGNVGAFVDLIYSQPSIQSVIYHTAGDPATNMTRLGSAQIVPPDMKLSEFIVYETDKRPERLLIETGIALRNKI